MVSGQAQQFAETESPSWVDRVRRYLLALYPQPVETGRLIAQSEPIALQQSDGLAAGDDLLDGHVREAGGASDGAP